MRLLSLATVYVAWGSTFFAIRVALAGFPPFLLGALRYLIAGLVLFLLVRKWPSAREWRGCAILALLLLLLGNALVVWAEQWVPSSTAALIFASVPIWAALFSALAGKAPTQAEGAAVFFGFCGVAVMQRGASTGDVPVLALLAVAVAAASMGLGAVVGKRLALPPSAVPAQLVIGGAVQLVLSIGVGERLTALPPLSSWLALAYLIVVGSILGYSAWLFVVRTFRPVIATSNSFVNPIVALLLGAGLLHEPVTTSGLAGLALVFVAMALLTASPSKGEQR